ncbi:cytochrome P450 [Streptomyces yaanensis]|uniref:Cytochrome P450 n=1 Tax=Streptomyces yaanensis TaxID=1142239 RepID=A0ABV7SFH5_9ACTN|nr:cytochrome P450 [Streptomyces sp. CGMCC 4.7035]WNB97686.1 cytochrome P450 [Streptomyces sp. CGMCC 4.7035]
MTVESAHSGTPQARRPSAGAEEPGEPPLAGGAVPLLGHGLQLVRDPVGFLAGLRDHGDVLRLKLGPKTVYAVTTPELTGAVALSPDYVVDGPLWESLRGLLGEQGVATTNGPLHQRQRRDMQPAFRLAALQGYGPVMEEEVYSLVERWRSGETIDVTAESFRVTPRIATRCLMRGTYTDTRADRVSAALTTLFSGMYQRMVVPLGPLYRLPLPANRAFNQALADFHRLADEIIAERRASGQKPDDLLTVLLEAKDENGDPIGEQEIHDQVVAIAVAGNETLGSTVMSLLRVFTEHPEQASLIHDEVKTVVGDRPVGFEDVDKLTHTRNVVVETIRLYPAVWILMHRAAADTVLGGYRIPAGADVVYSPYAIQCDPRSYQRHLEFDPDRWLPERAKDVPKFAMIPFSVGNRKCPGDHFSMVVLTLIAAVVASTYRFEQAPGSDIRPRIGITLRPRRLLLKAIPR